MKLINGNPEDLVIDKYGAICCPYCKEWLKAMSPTMDGNRFLYHSCKSTKDRKIRYRFSGYSKELRKTINAQKEEKKEE